MTTRRGLLFAAAPMLLRAQRIQRTETTLTGNDQVAALLQRMQAALGGVDRFSAIRDVDWTTIGKTWNASGDPGPDAERRIRWIRPNILRKDQRVGNTVVSYFFDGEGGWELLPDAGLIQLEGRELEFVRGEARGFYPNKWFPDRDPRLRITSGGPGIIRITKVGSDRPSDIIVDLESGLPVQMSSALLSGKPTTTYRRIRQRMEFVEWQTVDGVRWPRKLRNFHDDSMLVEITTTAIKINSGLDPAELSRKPQG